MCTSIEVAKLETNKLIRFSSSIGSLSNSFENWATNRIKCPKIRSITRFKAWIPPSIKIAPINDSKTPPKIFGGLNISI